MKQIYERTMLTIQAVSRVDDTSEVRIQTQIATPITKWARSALEELLYPSQNKTN